MGYGTGAIMAVPGQDERDWEFADALRPADRAHRRSRPRAGTGEAFIGDGPGDQLGQRRDLAWTGCGVDRGQGARSSTGWRRTGTGAAHRHLQAARLAVQPAALLGRAVPDRLRRARPARSRCPSRCCRSSCPRSTTTRRAPSPRTTARPSRSRRWPARPTGSTVDAGPGRRPEALPPRDQHDAAVGRLLLVRAALPGPDQHRARSSTPRSSGTGWARRARATPAASTCTSAASSTPCCTCCTRASGTRCCSTWVTCRAASRSTGCSTRAMIQAYAYTDERGLYVAGRRGRSRTAHGGVHLARASRSPVSTGRWARA